MAKSKSSNIPLDKKEKASQIKSEEGLRQQVAVDKKKSKEGMLTNPKDKMKDKKKGCNHSCC